MSSHEARVIAEETTLLLEKHAGKLYMTALNDWRWEPDRIERALRPLVETRQYADGLLAEIDRFLTPPKHRPLWRRLLGR